MEKFLNELIKVDGKIIKDVVLKNTTCKEKNADYQYHVFLLEKTLGYSLLITLECFNEKSLYSYETGLSKEDALNKYNEVIALDY